MHCLSNNCDWINEAIIDFQAHLLCRSNEQVRIVLIDDSSAEQNLILISVSQAFETEVASAFTHFFNATKDVEYAQTDVDNSPFCGDLADTTAYIVKYGLEDIINDKTRNLMESTGYVSIVFDGRNHLTGISGSSKISRPPAPSPPTPIPQGGSGVKTSLTKWLIGGVVVLPLALIGAVAFLLQIRRRRCKTQMPVSVNLDGNLNEKFLQQENEPDYLQMLSRMYKKPEGEHLETESLKLSAQAEKI